MVPQPPHGAGAVGRQCTTVNPGRVRSHYGMSTRQGSAFERTLLCHSRVSMLSFFLQSSAPTMIADRQQLPWHISGVGHASVGPPPESDAAATFWLVGYGHGLTICPVLRNKPPGGGGDVPVFCILWTHSFSRPPWGGSTRSGHGSPNHHPGGARRAARFAMPAECGQWARVHRRWHASRPTARPAT